MTQSKIELVGEIIKQYWSKLCRSCTCFLCLWLSLPEDSLSPGRSQQPNCFHSWVQTTCHVTLLSISEVLAIDLSMYTWNHHDKLDSNEMTRENCIERFNWPSPELKANGMQTNSRLVALLPTNLPSYPPTPSSNQGKGKDWSWGRHCYGFRQTHWVRRVAVPQQKNLDSRQATWTPTLVVTTNVREVVTHVHWVTTSSGASSWIAWFPSVSLP